MKYAGRLGQMALVTKLQSIARTKDGEIEEEKEQEEIEGRDASNGKRTTVKRIEKEYEEVEEDLAVPFPVQAKPPVEIRPMSLSMKRQNPFRKSGKSPTLKGEFNHFVSLLFAILFCRFKMTGKFDVLFFIRRSSGYEPTARESSCDIIVSITG